MRPWKSRPLFLACLALVPVLSLGSAAKPKPGPEALVVSDARPEHAAEFEPTPEKPVYYVLLGSREYSLGAVWAGERQPDRAILEQEIVRVLASRNYRRTEVGGPMPRLALIVSWGSANVMIDDIESTDDSGASTTTQLVWNHREIAVLVGAHKASQKLLSHAEADAINDAARQDRLYIMVAAYDALALAKKQKTLIWRTRVSIESRRTSLPESLTVMLESAGPYFGRDTALPVFVDDNLRRNAEVKIGTPVVVPPRVEPAEKQR